MYRLAEVSRRTSSTSASPRACRSPASTAACSTTARSAARRCRRTFYARGQTGQQLLLGAYQALVRQVGLGQRSSCYTRTRDARRRGRRTAVPPASSSATCSPARSRSHAGARRRARHRRLLATSSSCRPTPRPATSPRRGGPTSGARTFANPCFTQIHPTCIPPSDEFQSKLTLMSESLRNDGRIWVPKNADDTRPPDQIPEDERDYFLERRYPAFGNLVPRDVASRARQARWSTSGRGVGPLKNGVYLDFADAIERLGRGRRSRSATATSSRCTSASPTRTRTRCRCASTRRRHYTMGGLWVDYDLMTTVPGLYALGEANFSDHGANRLGASALMQGLADGYFVAAVHDRRLPRPAARQPTPVPTDDPAFTARRGRGRATRFDGYLVDQGHPLGRLLPPRARQDHVGQLRHGAHRAGPREGARPRSRRCASEFQQGRAGARRRRDAQPVAREGRPGRRLLRARRADVPRRPRTARSRCGGHFRDEHQTEDGEALRDDEHFAYVAAWEWTGDADAADAPQGAARVRERPPRRSGATSRATTLQPHAARSGARPGPTTPGTFETYDAPDISDEMSFLEMLDVVNERLIDDGRGADRVRPRLPRGHLRHRAR